MQKHTPVVLPSIHRIPIRKCKEEVEEAFALFLYVAALIVITIRVDTCVWKEEASHE